MPSDNLKPRQLKRIGRIEERNPARAARVADRMEKRNTRQERGKAVVNKNSSFVFKISDFKKDSDKIKMDNVQKIKAKERVKISRPDTPLAETPKIK